MRFGSLLIALLTLAPAQASGQDLLDRSTQRPQIHLAVSEAPLRFEIEGGATVYGRVAALLGDTVRIALLSGDVLEVLRGRIRSAVAFEGKVVNGEVWEPDPNETRLFFGPTARSLGRGAGYLAMYYAIMPFVGLGIGDRITVAGGAPLFLGEGMFQMFWLAPKVEVVRTGSVRGSVGTLSFFSEKGNAGVLYGVATVGRTADAAGTFGIGYGYSSGEGLANTPALLAGFEKRVRPGVKLISENYLFLEEGVLLAVGPRFIGKRLTADLAMVVPLFGNQPVALPFVNFVWNW